MRSKSVDTPFLILVCALVVFGLLIFTSAALGLLARDGGASFTSVAVSQLLLGLLVGVLVYLGLTILDVKYALVLAILAALFTSVHVRRRFGVGSILLRPPKSKGGARLARRENRDELLILLNFSKSAAR